MKLQQLTSNILEAKQSSKKIDRSAFIYLSPKGDGENFAQCGTCVAFLPSKKRCAWFGKNDRVLATASCALYVNGQPNDNQKIISSVTPAAAGYVNEQVRCENCQYAKNQKCMLFDMLNKSLPDIFDLDINIESKACCNAWVKYQP